MIILHPCHYLNLLFYFTHTCLMIYLLQPYLWLSIFLTYCKTRETSGIYTTHKPKTLFWYHPIFPSPLFSVSISDVSIDSYSVSLSVIHIPIQWYDPRIIKYHKNRCLAIRNCLIIFFLAFLGLLNFSTPAYTLPGSNDVLIYKILQDNSLQLAYFDRIIISITKSLPGSTSEPHKSNLSSSNIQLTLIKCYPYFDTIININKTDVYNLLPQISISDTDSIPYFLDLRENSVINNDDKLITNFKMTNVRVKGVGG